MEVQFTPDQQAFLRDAIQSGRIRREEDAFQEAMAMWEERERARAEILAAVEIAEASLARGEAIELTPESVEELLSGVKRRGRAHLAAEMNRTS
jgi:Arc/MetJ-type ribon-helix-helix transcriptional regulator